MKEQLKILNDIKNSKYITNALSSYLKENYNTIDKHLFKILVLVYIETFRQDFITKEVIEKVIKEVEL